MFKCNVVLSCFLSGLYKKIFMLNGITQRKSNIPKFTEMNIIRCSNRNKYLRNILLVFEQKSVYR